VITGWCLRAISRSGTLSDFDPFAVSVQNTSLNVGCPVLSKPDIWHAVYVRARSQRAFGVEDRQRS
jgi:hypothetical protein